MPPCAVPTLYSSYCKYLHYYFLNSHRGFLSFCYSLFHAVSFAHFNNVCRSYAHFQMKRTPTENDGAGRAQLNTVKLCANVVPYCASAVPYCANTVQYSDSKNLLIRKASELMVFKENEIFQRLFDYRNSGL
jgi:hypothetical protein